MKPHTQFDETIYISENRITVKGPVANPDEDDDVRRAVVFAFVTQQLPGATAATVAGEALLYPVQSPRKGPVWWLVCPTPASSLEPGPPTLEPKGTSDAVGAAKEFETHSFDYDYRKSREWYFDTEMREDNELQEGPAFGTAILLTFMHDGSIETYAWSGWMKVERRRSGGGRAAAKRPLS